MEALTSLPLLNALILHIPSRFPERPILTGPSIVVSASRHYAELRSKVLKTMIRVGCPAIPTAEVPSTSCKASSKGVNVVRRNIGALTAVTQLAKTRNVVANQAREPKG